MQVRVARNKQYTKSRLPFVSVRELLLRAISQHQYRQKTYSFPPYHAAMVWQKVCGSGFAFF